VVHAVSHLFNFVRADFSVAVFFESCLESFFFSFNVSFFGYFGSRIFSGSFFSQHTESSVRNHHH